jgi:putative phosphoribosyl transferase
MIFTDRSDAGRQLASRLLAYASAGALVLGLPRGGVVVAAEVAEALAAPLDVWVVRKLGAPAQPELGLGAIAEGGGVFIDAELTGRIGVDARALAALIAREQIELDRRVRVYRGGRSLPPIEGRTVILVDDGLATGGTARAAISALAALRPARLVFAVPVAASDSLEPIEGLVDEVVVAQSIEDLRSIGEWDADFTQTADDEVLALLAQSRARRAV